jgi:hypothetical protein
MRTYRDVVLWNGTSDEAPRITSVVVRVRLLGMVITLSEERDEMDTMIACYEEEGGGIIVYEVRSSEKSGRLAARWQRFASLDEVRQNSLYATFAQRLAL